MHCVQFTHRTLQDYHLQKCRAGCPHPAACARFHQGLAFYLIPPPPCGQGEFGPVRPGGGAGLAIRSSLQYAPIPASAPCDKAHYLQKGAIQQWNCSFFLLCYVLPKTRLFSRADRRTDGENPAPPDQRAAASNPGCVAGAGHSWGSPRR